MIRPIRETDREEYLTMAKAFFESEAVLSPIPAENIEKTFDLLMEGSPFASAYIFEEKGKAVGYALLAHTWSQEAGGEVVWIEEIYLLPKARSKGYGKEFFLFLENDLKKSAKRFRMDVEKENERAIALYRSLGFEFFPYDQMKKDF